MSAAISFIAVFALTIVFAQPATAQSRVVAKWAATVSDPVNASNMNFVHSAAAGSNGDVAVAGNICVALQSNGECGDQEFQIETYNSSGQRLWGSTIAASFTVDDNSATSVVFDSSNDVYAAGAIFNPPPPNSIEPTESMMIVKYSASGTREWIRYYGNYQNSSFDACFVQAITSDQQNNVYVAGTCADSNAPHLQVLKYSPSGQLLWIGTFTSITDYDGYVETQFSPAAIAVYDNTDVYVAGWAAIHASHPVTLKYDQNGKLVWQRMTDGSIASWGEPDTPNSIALDSAGNIYEEGTSQNGISGAYALKYDPSGDLLWLTQASEPDCTKGDEHNAIVGNAIGLDRSGNVFLSSNDCDNAVVVTKFDSNGNLLWQSLDNTRNHLVAFYVNGAGDTYVLCGSIVIGPAIPDFETFKYDSDGKLQWSIAYAGIGNAPDNIPSAMAASGGDLYVAGSTGGSGSSGSPTDWVTLDYVQDAADATPTSLTFSSQVVDTTSAPQSVTLKNTSSEDLDISSIQMTGPFSENNNCSSEIVAGGSCTIAVRFTPTSTGTQSGSLSIFDQWAGSPDVVKLTGTGAQ